MRFWAESLLFLGFLPPLLAQSQPPEVLILTNVNIVDTRYGAVTENHTVVIKEGRITAIARHGLIGGNGKVQVVNATGKYLIPGLWDMHVHTAGGPAAPWDEQIIYPLFVANGVTGIRDMGGDLDLLDRRHGHIWTGKIVGPYMLRAGPFLNAGKSDDQTLGVNNPSEARAAVDRLKQKGVDFVTVLSGLSRESYFAIVAEAGKQHLPVVGHLPETVSVREASVAGQHSIEHLAGVMLACSGHENELRQRRLDDLATGKPEDYQDAAMDAIASYDSNNASALFMQLAENETWQVPTLSWWRAVATKRDKAAAGDGRLKYVPASARVQWQPDGEDHGQNAGLKTASARYVELAGAMRHAGVPFLAGTDGPDPYVFPGFSLHEELELMTQGGFTNLEALQTATLNPAIFQHKTDQYGVVEVGRIADLVVLDGNPLADIRNTRKINGVVLGGRYFDRAQLDRLLADVADLAEADKTIQRGAEPAESKAVTALR